MTKKIVPSLLYIRLPNTPRHLGYREMAHPSIVKTYLNAPKLQNVTEPIVVGKSANCVTSSLGSHSHPKSSRRMDN